MSVCQLVHISLDADIWLQIPIKHIALCFVVAVMAIMDVSKKLSKVMKAIERVDLLPGLG